MDVDDVVPDEWYEECFDTTNGATDSGGDTCAWYEKHIDYCGRYDTEDFSAMRMCCVCHWNNEVDSDEVEELYEDCQNTNGDAVDAYRSDCTWYDEFPEDCGRYDNRDFDAVEMCCACANHEEDLHWRYDESFEEVTYLSDYEDQVEREEAEEEEATEEETEESEESEEGVLDTALGIFTDEKVAGDKIDYEALEEFSEEEWEEFVQEDINPFDPTTDWNDLASALTNFQDGQAAAEDAYQECFDTAEDNVDEWGNGCDMYTDYPNTCGAGDTDSFVAGRLCCACGGGSTAD